MLQLHLFSIPNKIFNTCRNGVCRFGLYLQGIKMSISALSSLVWCSSAICPASHFLSNVENKKFQTETRLQASCSSLIKNFRVTEQHLSRILGAFGKVKNDWLMVALGFHQPTNHIERLLRKQSHKSLHQNLVPMLPKFQDCRLQIRPDLVKWLTVKNLPSTHYFKIQQFNRYSSSIRRITKEKGTGAEMCLPSVSGIVTGDAPVSYWPILSLSLVTVPEVFAKVNSAQSPRLLKWQMQTTPYLVIRVHFISNKRWMNPCKL